MATAKDAEMKDKAEDVWRMLDQRNDLKGEVLLDDRIGESPGLKMKEAQFLGFPYVVIVGKAMKNNGMLELQLRQSGRNLLLSKEDLFKFFSGELTLPEK